jgi:hypothetical protein
MHVCRESALGALCKAQLDRDDLHDKIAGFRV